MEVRATKGGGGWRAVDYGKSLAPLVEVVGGRYLRFDEQKDNDKTTIRTINTWDYPGLEEGVMPSDLQKAFVVADLMQLSRSSDNLSEDIFTKLVGEVYQNHGPRNQPGRDKHEPRLSHLIQLLKSAPFQHHLGKER